MTKSLQRINLVAKHYDKVANIEKLKLWFALVGLQD